MAKTKANQTTPTTRRVIHPMPVDKADRKLARASKWNTPEGELFIGRVYELSAQLANYLVAKKGFVFVDTNGKPTEEAAPEWKPELRPGQEGWLPEAEEDDEDETPASEPPAQPADDTTTPTNEPTL